LTSAKFGVFLPSYAFQYEKTPQSYFNSLLSLVRECEQLGFHSIWLDDHVMYGGSQILECWTALAALAAATSRIRLGTMVTSNGFRNPALLAKMAATADVISNGRLELGVGAGIQAQEYQAYGYSFPKVAERISRLAETLEIVKLMWTKEKASFNGKYSKISDAICEPKPLQKPYPPIVVGGSGEKLTLKVTAQYADRFDFGYLPSLSEYKRKLGVLQKHCEAIGRSFSNIEKSCWPAGQIFLAANDVEAESKMVQFKPQNVSKQQFESYSFVGSADQFAKALGQYTQLDVSRFMLFFGDLPETSSLKLFAKKFIH
jgi:F420-dependent oxidoreductase-like protein